MSGSFPIEIRVTDFESRQTFANLSLVLFAELVFAETELPRGQVDVFYNATLTAAGGTGPYTISLVAGPLPPGMAFNASNATLSGMPTLEGVFDLSFLVVDSLGWNSTLTAPLIVAPVPGGQPVIATTTLASGLTETPYNASLEVLGGMGPFVWSIAAGSLPPGLVLDSAVGQISGIPTVAGNFLFSMRVDDSVARNATRVLSIQVISPVRTITLGALNITVLTIGHPLDGLNVSIRYVSTNTTAPVGLTAVGLPPGLNLTLAGVLSGTPTAAGNFSFDVTAFDSSGVPVTANRTYSLVVIRIGIDAQPLRNGTVGDAMVASLHGTNWTGQVAWSITSGELPPGLRLDANGTLRGTPTTPGTFTFTVEAREPGSLLNFDARSFTVTVRQSPGIIGDPSGPSPVFYLVLVLLAAAIAALVMNEHRIRGRPRR